MNAGLPGRLALGCCLFLAALFGPPGLGGAPNHGAAAVYSEPDRTVSASAGAQPGLATPAGGGTDRPVDGWDGGVGGRFAGRIVKRKQPLPALLQEPACWMALILTGIGALLVLGPEFVFLRDNFWSRMNTLFKFYYQAWILWALAGAFATWYLWRFGSRRLRLGLGLAVGLPVLLGLVYLPAALWSKTGGFSGSPTLDGMAYFARQYPGDWAVVQWLDENAAPGAVIVEGSQGAYWVEGRSSRISMATGLPTLIGWANHESQWRGRYFNQVSQRIEDLRLIYQSRDWENIEALLDAYQVEYVLVSDLEREWYRPLQETKFLQNMRAVLQAGDLTLYQRR